MTRSTNNRPTMAELTDQAINRAVRAIWSWMDDAGLSLDEAVARVHPTTTFGPRAWDEVIDRATDAMG